MAGVVGKAVQDEVRSFGTMDDQRGFVVAQRRQLREGALHRRRVTWRLDVFHAPIGVKLLHVFVERTKEKKGSEKKRASWESQSRRRRVSSRAGWFCGSE